MRNSLILASLALDAVSHIGFRDVKNLTSDQGGSIDSALLTGTDGNHYVVRMGKTDQAGLELATEVAALGVLSGSELPFKLSRVVGESRGARSNPATNQSIGSAIAAIHNLSAEGVREAGFPEFGPAETARLRVNELDRVAGTGKVPKVLLDRWSEALENVNLFRFTQTVVHGNLNSNNVLELDGEVSGILGWHGLKVGDPAEDFAWLAATGSSELLDAVRFAYLAARSVNDPNLAQRAHLYAEMNQARWLLHGVTIGDQEIVADGVAMLEVLAEEVTTGVSPALIAGAFALPVAGGFIEAVEDTEPELEVQQEPTALEVDDRTREIELPERKDDELF
jgi:macrolide phosphotransferase